VRGVVGLQVTLPHFSNQCIFRQALDDDSIILAVLAMLFLRKNFTIRPFQMANQAMKRTIYSISRACILHLCCPTLKYLLQIWPNGNVAPGMSSQAGAEHEWHTGVICLYPLIIPRCRISLRAISLCFLLTTSQCKLPEATRNFYVDGHKPKPH
jgi:hypothetical protein